MVAASLRHRRRPELEQRRRRTVESVLKRQLRHPPAAILHGNRSTRRVGDRTQSHTPTRARRNRADVTTAANRLLRPAAASESHTSSAQNERILRVPVKERGKPAKIRFVHPLNSCRDHDDGAPRTTHPKRRCIRDGGVCRRARSKNLRGNLSRIPFDLSIWNGLSSQPAAFARKLIGYFHPQSRADPTGCLGQFSGRL